MQAKKKIANPVVVLNDNFQVALDSKCLILQSKILSDENTKDLSSEEKKSGFVNLGYFTTWESLGSYIVKDLARERAKSITKKDVLTLSGYIDIINKSVQEVNEMFKKIDDKSKINKK